MMLAKIRFMSTAYLIKKLAMSILDDVIAVDTEEFDNFLEKLKKTEFRKPVKQEIITQGKLFE